MYKQTNHYGAIPYNGTLVNGQSKTEDCLFIIAHKCTKFISFNMILYILFLDNQIFTILKKQAFLR